MTNTQPLTGLTDAEVVESRRLHGDNVLTPPAKEPLWRKFLAKLTDPLIIILLVAAALSIGIAFYEYFGLGHDATAFLEPIGILLAVVLATGLAFIFETKAEREFEILNKVNDDEPVRVIRNGQSQQIPKRDVVAGDVVMIGTGDEIPADGTLIDAVALMVDESSLTGEPACAKTTDSRYSHPQMTQPLEFSFTTKNRDRLEILDHFPADGGTVDYVSPTLEFRFDKTINSNGAYDMVTITDSKGNDVAVNKRTSKFNRLTNGYGNAIFAITGDLVPGEKYHVKLSGALRDTESLPLGNDIEFDFTAVDATSEVEQTTVEDFETAVNFAVDPEQTTGTAANPTATRSTAVKLFDKASGRFSYKFADSHGGSIVWKYTGEPHAYNTNDILGMYINGDFNNHELYVGVASGTNIKYKKVCDLDFIGWQYREVTLDNLEKDFCPFLLSEIKVVQQKSPITQNGHHLPSRIRWRK